jgi:hypothetical protein
MLGGELLETLGLPARLGAVPDSTKRFPDGAHYRIEIPSVEGPEVCSAVLDEASARGVGLHRVSQGSGVTMLTREELGRWARLGADHQLEVCLYVRPTASWGTGAAWLSPTGQPLAGQVHGLSQLGAALDQVRRAVRAGFRSVLVTDVGVVSAITQLKALGHLPADLVVKAGVQMGVANPLAARLVEQLGATTINVPSDLSLADLAALRSCVDAPLDIYLESPDDLGGFIRTHEIADIVRVAAPVYLKFGLRNAVPLYPSGTHTQALAATLARERVRRAQLGLELLQEIDSSLTATTGASDLAVPHPQA